MITISTKIEHKGDGFDKWIENLKKATQGPKAVKVGFPKGKSKADIIAIAVYNHNGTSRGIPPRPFITAAMFKGRQRIREHLRNSAAKVVRGEQSFEQALPKIGLLGQGLIQKQIAGNMPPPNAPATVKKKGSSKTLIDTGQMRQSVSWEVDK